VSDNKRTFDLILRGQDYATKTIADVGTALEGLEKKVDDQAASARQGVGGVDALRAALVELRKLSQTIAKDQGLIVTFDRQKEALEAQRAAVNNQKAALDALIAKQTAATTGASKYNKQITDAKKALEVVIRDESRAEVAYERTAKALEAIGVSTSRSKDGMESLNAQALKVEDTFHKAAVSVDQYAEAQRRAGQEAARASAQILAAQAKEGALNARALVGDPRAPTNRSLSTAITGTVSPSAGARTSLAGIDEELDRAAQTAETASLALGRYAEALARVNEAGQALTNKARLAEDFFAQEQATVQATMATDRHKASVISLADALARADDPTAQMTTELRRAEAAHAAATTEELRQATALESLRAKMQQAGVSTQSLAAAQTQLAHSAQRVATTQNALQQKVGSQGSGGFLGLKPYELQNLSYQVNDFFTQIASGTSVMQAFAQQGGQVFQLFPGAGAAILAALPAILAGGSAIAALVVGFNQLTEQDKAAKAFSGRLAVMADGAAYSAEALGELQDELGFVGVKSKEAGELLGLFVQKGVRPDLLDDFAASAKNLADALGVDLKEAVGLVAEGFTGGEDAVLALDDKLNFLSDSQRQTVRDMYATGDATGAANLAFEIFKDNVADGADKARGPWKEAFQALGGAIESLAQELALAVSDALNLEGAMDGLTDTLEGAARALRVYAYERGRGQAVSAERFATDVAETGVLVKAEEELARLRARRRAGEAGSRPAAQGFEFSTNAKETLDQRIARLTGTVATITTRLFADRDAALATSGGALALDRTTSSDERRAEADRKERERASKLAVAKTERERKRLLAAQKRERAKEARDAKRERAKEAREAAQAVREAARNARAYEVSQDRAGSNLASVLGLVGRDDQESLPARLDAVKGQFAKFYNDLDDLKEKAAKAGIARANIRVDGATLGEVEDRLDKAQKVLQRRATVDFYDDLASTAKKARDEQLTLVNQLLDAAIIDPEEAFKRSREVIERAAAGIREGLQKKLDAQTPLGLDLLDQLSLAEEALAAARARDLAARQAAARAEAARAPRGAEVVTVTATDPSKFLALQAAVESARTALQSFEQQRQRTVTALETADSEAKTQLREANLRSLAKLQEDLTAAEDRRARAVARIQEQVEEGQISEFEGNKRITETYIAARPAIEAYLSRMRSLVDTLVAVGAIGPAAAEQLRASLEQASKAAEATDANMKRVADTITNGLSAGVDKGLDAFIVKLGEVMDGTATLGDLWKSVGDTILSTISDILIDLAKFILKAAIMNQLMKIPALKKIIDAANGNTAGGLKEASTALTAAAAPWAVVVSGLLAAASALKVAAASSGGGGGGRGALSALFGAGKAFLGVNHSGGLGSDMSRTRAVSFSGLDATEMLKVVRKDEEVLTTDDPRHVANQGFAASAPQADNRYTVTNILDTETLVRQGISSRGGVDGLLTVIQKNKGAVKAALGM
jgi:hypothetical protein